MEVEKEMIGGLMKTTSRFAVASAAGLFMGGIALTPAQAADLGGDCCADLEERVAELEATTVRKGNRVMSVKLSGHVARVVMWWDDGDESNVYVGDHGFSTTRYRFTGDANWRPGWKIGFALEWQQHDDGVNGMNATSDDPVANSPTVRQAHWWVRSDKLGKLSVGQLSAASDSTSEVNLSGGAIAGSTLLRGISGGGFALVNNAAQTTPTGFRSTTFTWGNLGPGDLDGLSRQDGVRYDSPTFAGFTLSTGWYEDDMWDVALRFAKQWNSVLVAAAVSYAEDREGAQLAFCGLTSGVNTLNGGGDDADCDQVNGSISVLHQPTGLFATFAAGHAEDGNRNDHAASVATTIGTGSGVSVDDEANFWYVNAGIYRRFNEWGKTSIGVEYMDSECGFGSCAEIFRTSNANDRAFFGIGTATAIGHTENQTWGVWLVQHIDNAATEFYISYHNTDGDVDWISTAAGTAGQNVSSSNFEDIDVVIAGARVKF
jgi:hypothetical protein